MQSLFATLGGVRERRWTGKRGGRGRGRGRGGGREGEGSARKRKDKEGEVIKRVGIGEVGRIREKEEVEDEEGGGED